MVVLLLPVVLMVPLTAYKPAAATILRSRELCTRTKRSRTRHGRLDETSACVSANFRISSRIMLITRHGVATTSVLPRARCFDDRRRAASSVISSRRECKRERERGEREGREREKKQSGNGWHTVRWRRHDNTGYQLRKKSIYPPFHSSQVRTPF